MFVYRKIRRALFSWSTCYEIRPFALLPKICAKFLLLPPRLSSGFKCCCYWRCSIQTMELQAYLNCFKMLSLLLFSTSYIKGVFITSIYKTNKLIILLLRMYLHRKYKEIWSIVDVISFFFFFQKKCAVYNVFRLKRYHMETSDVPTSFFVDLE